MPKSDAEIKWDAAASHFLAVHGWGAEVEDLDARLSARSRRLSVSHGGHLLRYWSAEDSVTIQKITHKDRFPKDSIRKIMALAFGSAFRLGVFCSVSILIAACGDKEEAAQPITSQQTTKQLEQAEAKALEAERRLREAEKERIADAEARQILEHQHKVALEEGKSSERITWILGVLVVIALLVGIAIGSSSRKDANSSKQ